MKNNYNNLSNEEKIKQLRLEQEKKIVSGNTIKFLLFTLAVFIISRITNNENLANAVYIWLIIDAVSLVVDFLFKKIFIQKKAKDNRRLKIYYEFIYECIGTIVILEMLYFQSHKMIILIAAAIFLLLVFLILHTWSKDKEYFEQTMDMLIAREDEKYEKLLDKLNRLDAKRDEILKKLDDKKDDDDKNDK